MSAPPLASVGRYAVRRRIGSGSFATVWLAYDEQLDSPVAVKVLADNWALDDQVRRRFVEEGRFLRRVDSPHVVSVHDAGELADGRPYLVMTYADRGSLADRWPATSGRGWPPGQALTVVRQVADGLQALHDRGVVHRDVKPGNVLFKSSGPRSRAMLGDLGLGRSLDLSSRLTVVAGTPLFVAPEQAAAESPDARADQYSLAVLAFLLLAGRPPYDHASLQAAADPGPPPALPDTFPAEASQVLRRALSRDRDARWPTVTDLADALVDALHHHAPEPVDLPALPDEAGGESSTDPGGLTVDHPPPTVAGESSTDRGRQTVDHSPPRRRVLRWVAAVVAVALVGGAAGWVAERRLPDHRTVRDDEGTLSITVPEAWNVVARSGWWPPSDSGGAGTFPAVSAGSRSDWAGHGGEGVFVGLLPGTRLPAEVPQHPECDAAGEPLPDRTAAGDPMVTVFFTGCPGVAVERVVLITENRLLWVQVEARTRATVNEVLDGVRTSGL